MKILSGKTGAPGIAIGPVMLREDHVRVFNTETAEPAQEIKRFDAALAVLPDRFSDLLSSAAPENRGILEARKMMLEDPSLLDAIRAGIRSGKTAEAASLSVTEEKAAALEKNENEYLRSRSADLRDIGRFLADHLSGRPDRSCPDVPSVIFADEITPEEISAADRNNVLAYVTRKGSPASHASIVAGNCGIPYLYGVDPDVAVLRSAALVAVDAAEGKLILDPDEGTLAELTRRKAEDTRVRIIRDVSETGIRVCANIGSPEDAKQALRYGADGVGLFRTEFLFMKKETPPDEEEQFEAYRSAAEYMQGKEVIIRTLDLGADKQASCLTLAPEENPALGHRAIRVCLDRPELFRTQLRAILRAAVYGNIKIMFPMIASIGEIDDAMEQVRLAAAGLNAEGIPCRIPPVGIMVETPAAAVLSEELARKADFFSIGTNDLAQYTLAADRTGKDMERYYRPGDEAVLRLIRMTAEGAKKAGIPVGICGEIGGDPAIIPLLAEMGISELSMSPARIPKAKQILADLSAVSADEPADEFEAFGAPADGRLIPMEQIPDPAFSSGVLGKCIGIEPESGNIYAPVSGTVTMVADTLHAIGIRSDGGHEILIHIGIDTVALKGKGFTCSLKAGARVEKNDLIMTADPDVIRAAGLNATVILVLLK
ncbi:MAG: phosphoenolpyruvate--protein phosphotransferase [Clostridia bacterium]|nr:phosphoenolpyruvate--protein phosphotransferase [Clostridia bacterium]